MGKELDMKDAEPAAEASDSKADADKMQTDEAPPKPTAQDLLANNVALLEKAVRMKDTRLVMGRVLRQTGTVRKLLQPDVLSTFVRSTLPEGNPARPMLLAAINKASGGMDTDDAVQANGGAAEPAGLIPEVETYATLLVVIFLTDQKLFEEAKSVSSAALTRLSKFNRRTLDVLAARIYFYLSWSHECTGTLATIRSTLLALHRTAVLRHDDIGQETLLNLLLRNYLHYNLYDQAEKLRSKAQRPEQSRSNQQHCRYLYYLGCIRAIQLEYTEAKDCLQQAARKAPKIAHGFRVMVNKWLILVRLLLGEIPERTDFTQTGMRQALLPYFELTQAVRSGDLAAFKAVSEKFDSVFKVDKTGNLIVRLRHNVIRTGLRHINLAYSRISLADIAAKLGLAQVEDTECIVAKAIRDGGIDAVLDHENSMMMSKEVLDIYSTDEPQGAFHARIAFCMDIHNEAVKAMRFEPDAYRRTLENPEARKERQAAEQELAKALEEDDEF